MKKTTHIRISTALPKDLLTHIDVLVKAFRYPSRSAFIEEALAQKLREHGEIGMENEKSKAGREANAGDVPPLPAEASSPASIHHSPFTIHHD